MPFSTLYTKIQVKETGDNSSETTRRQPLSLSLLKLHPLFICPCGDSLFGISLLTQWAGTG